MSVKATPNGRWRVRIYHLGEQVSMATFDRKAEASAWEAEQKSTLSTHKWTNPKLGKTPLGKVIEAFNTYRASTIGKNSYETDRSNLRLYVSAEWRSRSIASIDKADFEDAYADLLHSLAKSTVKRHRDSLVALWRYARDRRFVGSNVAEESKLPKGAGTEIEEIRPFSKTQLAERIASARLKSAEYANLVEMLALTGGRWGEMVELRVGDLVEVPLPSIQISRSRSDGYEVGAPKSRKSRRVPLTSRAQTILAEQIAGKSVGDLVFQAPRGGQINGGNFKRALKWGSTSFDKRVQDLRHTAATGWIAQGIDIKTVSAWLGHSTSEITHRTYIHYLGGDADLAAIARLEEAAEKPDAVVTDISDAR